MMFFRDFFLLFMPMAIASLMLKVITLLSLIVAVYSFIDIDVNINFTTPLAMSIGGIFIFLLSILVDIKVEDKLNNS